MNTEYCELCDAQMQGVIKKINKKIVCPVCVERIKKGLWDKKGV